MPLASLLFVYLGYKREILLPRRQVSFSPDFLFISVYNRGATNDGLKAFMYLT